MEIRTAVEQLIETENAKGEKAYTPETLCFGVARVGMTGQRIVAGKMRDFLDIDMGPPLHSFIICAELHPIEQELYEYFSLKGKN
jgi:diphthine synthase